MEHELLFQILPGFAFAKDLNSRFRNASSEFVKQAGFKHFNEMLDLDDYNMPWVEFAEQYRKDDAYVVQFGRLQQFEYFLNYKREYSYLLVTKEPIYKDKNIIGIVASAQILSNSLQQQLVRLGFVDEKTTGKQSKYRLQNHYNKLTQRESEVFFLLIRYFSAKMIAKKLKISQRTVEKHIETIKEKLNLHSKNDIIDYAIEHHLIEIIIS